MEQCTACGWKGISLQMHLSNWRNVACMPAAPLAPALEGVARRCSTAASRLPSLEYERILGEHVQKMYLEKIMHQTHIRCAVALAQDAVSLLSSRIIKELESTAPQAVSTISSLVAGAVHSIKQLNDVERTCQRQCRVTIPAMVPRPLLGPDKIRRKHFAFFSLIDLIIDMLQNDSTARRHFLAKSRYWGTGVLYQKEPTVMRDFEDARRFRWSAAAKAFPTGEKLERVRGVIDSWNDDMTVNTSSCSRTRMSRFPFAVLPAAPAHGSDRARRAGPRCVDIEASYPRPCAATLQHYLLQCCCNAASRRSTRLE